MATKAEVAQLEYEKHCLKQKIMSLEDLHKKEIDELNAKHEAEIKQLKEDLHPVTLKEVKDLIDEAIHKLSLDIDDASWDPDDGCDPSHDVRLTYGKEELSSVNI